MTWLDDLKRALTDLKAEAFYPKWRQDNKGEVGRWDPYIAAVLSGAEPAEPTMTTAYGRELIDTVRLALDAKHAEAPVPPPPPPPPVNPYRDVVGVCAYRTADFDLIASLGVKHVRMDNPSAATIDLARSKGLEVLPIAGYCPWGDLNGGKSSHTPPLPQNVGTWAKRLVDQWRTMSAPPKVFEPWNEPWNFWDTVPKDPALYLAMVKAFAQEAWNVWPNATILVSADPNDITLGGVKIHWRDALLAADTGKFLTDPRVRPTVHVYCGSAAPDARSSNPCQWDFDRYNCVRDAFKVHGHPNPVPWPTELGWETNTPGGNPERTDLVTEQQQADYIVAAFKKLATAGVGTGYAFALKTAELDDYNWLRPDDTPKPVIAAVKALLT